MRTLLRGEPVAPGRVALEWDGRTETGALAADGSYRPSITLEQEGRTFVAPNFVELDGTAPTATLVSTEPKSAAPGDRITVRYRLSEPAQAILYVDGRRAVLVREARAAGRLDGSDAWTARSFRRGATSSPWPAATRQATSARTRPVTVTLR